LVQQWPNIDIGPILGQYWINILYRLGSIGRRAFLVAGAHTWNDLPVDVTSAPSLLAFRKRLKLHSHLYD